ncbi:MAG: hypothetical protein MR288_01615 [Firmicutes bacterium]|nr:hypothetical protein [Bacillota bacterium]MDY5042146.1 hypothetical protein [Eubacteriales bacterium]
MKTRQKLCLASSILAFITCAFYAYVAVMLINNVDGFATMMKETLIEMGTATSEDIAELLNMTASYIVIMSVASGIVGAYNVVLICLNDKIFYKLKILTVVVAIAYVVFAMNIITPILMLFAVRKPRQFNNPYTRSFENPNFGMNMSNEELHEQLKMRTMAEKIELIKHLHNEKAISDEEYNKLIDEIITNGVKDDDNNMF